MISSEILLFTVTAYVWATHAYEGPFTAPYEHCLASYVPKADPWTGYPYAFRCQRTVMYIQVVYKVLCVLMISFLLYKRIFERNSRIWMSYFAYALQESGTFVQEGFWNFDFLLFVGLDLGQGMTSVKLKIHEPKYSRVIVNKTEIKKSIRDILGDWATQVCRSQPADHSEAGCAAASLNGKADSVRWYERCQSIWDHREITL